MALPFQLDNSAVIKLSAVPFTRNSSIDFPYAIGCAAKVSPQLLERYAMCSARWVQCEEITNRMGFLSKHPTTGKPIPSPFINIGINYMNQAVRIWNEIFQIVKENCSTEYGESTPQDDLMERLLRARKG